MSELKDLVEELKVVDDELTEAETGDNIELIRSLEEDADKLCRWILEIDPNYFG